MISVSNAYKEAMNKNIRNRSYISVGIGVVNQEAQSSANFESASMYFSNSKLPFTSKKVNEYLTLDENFIKADGSQLFTPRDTQVAQYVDSGFVTFKALQSIRIMFNNTYSIKGLTIDFSSGFPTNFKVVSAEKEIEFENEEQIFTTTEVLGDTDFIEIVPITMNGGQQRLRINNIQFGIGLIYSNEDVSDSSYKANVSPISEELPQIDFSVSILDPNNRYDIDDSNSFINFLETKQKVSVSYGIELEDGSVEYVNKGMMYLDSWESSKGRMDFKATDIFAFMEDEYELGNKIYTRTAYQEAESILQDAGFEPDEYKIDESLRDVILENPMPICTHKEALQLLANACRCILYQNTEGLIVIQSNFANIIEPEDLNVTSNGEAEWSNLDNVMTGATTEYVEFTRNFIKLDGSQLFIPRNKNYEGTGYVSEQISNYQGFFETNPTIGFEFPAMTQYFGIEVVFGGNTPKKVAINTYKNGVKSSTTFDVEEKHSKFFGDFGSFQKMEIEVLETEPRNRVIINQIAFGDLSDYKLVRDNMTSEPKGFSDKKTKDVYVKLYTFKNEEREVNGVKEIIPKQIEDEVWFKRPLNPVGENQYVENPLIHTEEHAQKVAEWISNHFANNTEYDIEYRGEPRIGAGDLIFYESDVVGDIQTEIMEENLTFNGALKGHLILKKAIKLT